MKLRAIALGAIVGFAVAVVPSCGGSKCSPANCSGCCDSSSKCVQKPSNGNNTTCGNQGIACTDCGKTGQMCNPTTFACTGTGGSGGSSGGTGGGAAGGTAGGTGGGGLCDGCRLPTSGTCVPLTNTTVNNCGNSNVTCAMCNTGQLCTDAGVCQTPTQTKAIGESCGTNADCASVGSGAICKTMTSSGNATYTGGYCTIPCGTGTPIGSNCPTGARCVSLNPRYGENDVFCWDLCNPNGGDNCRTPGYACYTLGTFQACWIDPLPAQDAGPPADKVGQPCDAGIQCVNPPETGGGCIIETLPDGGPTGYVGGYCSRSPCVNSGDCSADGGAICLTVDSAGNTQCFRKCAASTVGQSDCRTGYVCEQYFTSLPDGGRQNSVDGYCDPNCNNVSGYCGNYSDGGAVVCSTPGYCQF